jgi:hypothetical protein
MEKRIKPKWSTYIPLVQRLIVYSYHSSINTYPARILYGDVITPNRGLSTEWIRSPEDNIQALTYDDYVIQLDQQIKNVVSASQKYQHKVIEKQFQKLPDEPTYYFVGDYVLASYPKNNPPDKFYSPWKGPLLVTEVREQVYFCKDLITGKINQYSLERLKPYNAHNTDYDPYDIALLDREEEFVVESIIAHKGNPKYKSDMYFLVQWKGYPGEDTWEP